VRPSKTNGRIISRSRTSRSMLAVARADPWRQRPRDTRIWILYAHWSSTGARPTKRCCDSHRNRLGRVSFARPTGRTRLDSQRPRVAGRSPIVGVTARTLNVPAGTVVVTKPKVYECARALGFGYGKSFQRIRHVTFPIQSEPSAPRSTGERNRQFIHIRPDRLGCRIPRTLCIRGSGRRRYADEANAADPIWQCPHV